MAELPDIQSLNISEKASTYLEYKDLERKHQNLLDLADDPQRLADIPIGQLLDMLVTVETFFQLRYEYIQKYIQQMDIPHEKFLAYLLKTMDTYLNIISNKFETTFEPPAIMGNYQRSIKHMRWLIQQDTNKLNRLKRARLEQSDRLEAELKLKIRQERLHLFYLIKRELEKLFPGISNNQCIDVIQYLNLALRVIYQNPTIYEDPYQSWRIEKYLSDLDTYLVSQFMVTQQLETILNLIRSQIDSVEFRFFVISIIKVTRSGRRYYLFTMPYTEGDELGIAIIPNAGPQLYTHNKTVYTSFGTLVTLS